MNTTADFGQGLQAQRLQALGFLAGGIAHDFNNLLTGIIGYAQLLRDDEGAPRTVVENAEMVLQASRRASDLVDTIVQFSRETEDRRNPVSLAVVAEEAVALLKAGVPGNINVVFDLASEDIPLISADPTQMHRIVMNLATNAVQAIGVNAGRIEIRVEADASLRGPLVRLSMRDDGPGMDAATAARIFDPYFTTKHSCGGAGLGLSIVREIVRAHDGSITLKSAPSQGSVFSIAFPAIPGSEASQVSEKPTAEQLPRGEGRRVLVVDDESIVVQVTKLLLEALGYRTVCHTDPLEAVDWLHPDREAFDAILTDFAMPGMNGLAFYRCAKKICPQTPVIITSGYLDASVVNEIRAAGIRHFLPKPHTIASLANTIAAALHEQRLGVEDGRPSGARHQTVCVVG